MYRRNDPRFRRTLNEISQTIENANETAQTSVFVFGHQYITPCLSGIYNSIQPCVERCLPPADQRRGRSQRRSRGPELSFDFYDDWEEDENADLLGWNNEEYDSFVDGPVPPVATNQQPGRQRAMSYGTRRDARGRHVELGGPDVDPAHGPTYFGFIGKIANKLGGSKNLRYKPSAAGLQEHPGATKRHGEEGEPLMTDDSDPDTPHRRDRTGRRRSGTTGSERTFDSLSSRGDLFPSDDEADAVPLDEEFAMVLERRTTGSGQDDGSASGKAKAGKRPGPGSRRSTRTASSRSTPRSKRLSRTSSRDAPVGPEMADAEILHVPILTELKQEEEQIRMEEESSILQRREAAQRLAEERGLAMSESMNVSRLYVLRQRLPIADDVPE